jgi:hypothetical protein
MITSRAKLVAKQGMALPWQLRFKRSEEMAHYAKNSVYLSIYLFIYFAFREWFWQLLSFVFLMAPGIEFACLIRVLLQIDSSFIYIRWQPSVTYDNFPYFTWTNKNLLSFASF